MATRRAWPMNSDMETYAIVAEDGELYPVTPNTRENAIQEAEMMKEDLRAQGDTRDVHRVHAVRVDHRIT